MIYKIYKTTTTNPQKYWWAIIAANRETLAHSEMYAAKASCYKAINIVRGCAADAEIEDTTI